MCPSQEPLCPGSCRPSPCLLQSNREAGTRADRRPTQRPPNQPPGCSTTALSSLTVTPRGKGCFLAVLRNSLISAILHRSLGPALAWPFAFTG